MLQLLAVVGEIAAGGAAAQEWPSEGSVGPTGIDYATRIEGIESEGGTGYPGEVAVDIQNDIGRVGGEDADGPARPCRHNRSVGFSLGRPASSGWKRGAWTSSLRFVR